MKKKTVMFDRSVFLSLHLKDKHYKKARQLFKKFAHCKMIISDIVMIEVINVLNRNQVSQTTINGILNECLHARNNLIVSWKHDWDIIRKITEAVRLRSNDLLVLYFAYSYKPEFFISFDKKLQKAYKYIITNQI